MAPLETLGFFMHGWVESGGMNLPQEYIEYQRNGETLEAFLSCEFPGYMQLWPLDQIDELNADYEVKELAPGFICFGSNGGGELLAFDHVGVIYCLPAIGLKPAIRVADNWLEFASHIEEWPKS